MKSHVCFVIILLIALILISREFLWISNSHRTVAESGFETFFVSNNTYLETGIYFNVSSEHLDNIVPDFQPRHPVYDHPTVSFESTIKSKLYSARKRFLYMTLNLKILKNRTNVRLTGTPKDATFIERVEKFSSVVNEERKKLLSSRGLRSWRDVQQPEKLSVIWGRDDDFLGKLVNREEVRLVILPWERSTSNSANVVVSEHYEWTASLTLCEWIRTPGFTKAHWDAVYNGTCQEDLEASRRPGDLEPMYFYGKPINRLHYWPNEGRHYPNYFYTDYPDVPLYLTVVQDGVVNLAGDVVTGSTKIVPFTCSHDNIPTIPNEYSQSPIYKEVFVVTQFWGEAFFHRMIEIIPRFVPYLTFLKENPSIRIHVPKDRDTLSEVMKILGLNPERTVTGIVRAKVVYLPQGTPCGFPHVQGLQLMSYHLRTYIRNQNSSKTLNNSTSSSLVLIKRSDARSFLRQREIESLLEDFAERNKLNFYIFSDAKMPGMIGTMSIFNSASIVVAPHGAGLANVVFSEPGTLVIEGVCNPPHVNMCYQFVSHVLGHRYHGIPSVSGCERHVNVDPQEVLGVLERYVALKIINLRR